MRRKKVYEKGVGIVMESKVRGISPASKTMFPNPEILREMSIKFVLLHLVQFLQMKTFRIITSGIEGTAALFWSTIAETDGWQVIYYVKTFSKRFKKDTAPKVVTVGSVASTPDSIKKRARAI